MYTKIAFATLILAGSSSAFGQLSVFTDQAAWEAAVANAGFTPMEETFDGITINDMQPAGSPYVVNSDFSITVEGAPDAANTAFIDGGEFEGEIFPDSGHTGYRHDFNTNIVAFGQFYEGAASGLGIQIATSLGNIDIFDDGGYSGFQNGFLGFLITDGSSISSITIIGSDADGGTAVGEIYDATNAAYAFIPTPGSALLLGLGAVAALRCRR